MLTALLTWRVAVPIAFAGTVAVGGWLDGFVRSGRQRIVVVGGGVMGASTAWALSRMGHKCLLIDNGEPFKSSWGETRIARMLNTDITSARLMLRARELWTDLEKQTERELLIPTGIVGMGKTEVVEMVADLVRKVGGQCDVVSGDELAERMGSKVALGSYEKALIDKNAWVVRASECLRSLLDAAIKGGARYLDHESVVAIDRSTKM
eukprot:Sspe_Gene.110624::Locus_91687_Transcript_2_3_Confidence_0.400_Length_662::g.110624::m.110624